MESISPINIALLSTGLAAIFSVFWYSFRATDRIEKERTQRNRMRSRLTRMLKRSLEN